MRRRRDRAWLGGSISEVRPKTVELAVDVVFAEAGEILRIEARPQAGRQPYAHLKESGRWFLIRIGDRNRPMTREEIIGSRSIEDGERILKKASERLRSDRAGVEEEGDEVFWLGIEPAREIELDVQEPRLTDYLTDPSLTGNRLQGWSFARLAYSPVLKRDALVADPRDLRSLEVRRNGGLRFKAPLRSLYWKGEPKEIWPYILLEYPVSAFRMARRIYEGHLQPDDLMVADLALIGVRGWKLRPGRPGVWGFEESEEFADGKDLVFEKPFVFSFGDEPDRCGYRLVERVYEAFSLKRDAIPQVFDSQTGRLVFPE